MAEQRPRPYDGDDRALTRRPSVPTLIAGLATLLASAYLLTDGRAWLPDVDPRWVLGGGALAVGLLLLVMSLRPRRDPGDE